MTMKLDHLPDGVTIVRDHPSLKASIIECAHDPGYRRDHDGKEGPLCRFCKGDASTTQNFTLPVKMLAEVSKEARKPEMQESLF